MADSVITQQQMTLLPEYQEEFLKNILSNVYRVDQEPVLDADGNPEFDEAGNPIMMSVPRGLAARNPLLGVPQFDEAGNPIYKRASDGSFLRDMQGNLIQEVVGGVPKTDVVGFTPAQTEAIRRGISGIGAYEDLLEDAEDTYTSGISTLEGSMGQYDPEGQILYETITDPMTGQITRRPSVDMSGGIRRIGGYKDFYDPFVEDVIDTAEADIQRQAERERTAGRAQAVGAGAFGGSRAMIADQEIQRAADDRKARTGAQLRSAAYTGAQQQAQSAFENAQKRGQTGAQLFQGLGTAQAGLGQLGQQMDFQDTTNLLKLGGLEQQQQQAEYDVQRQSAIEDAYEPFQRFSYATDIFRGVPSTQTTLTMGSAPRQNVIGSTIGGAMGLSAYQNQFGGSPILGGIINRG